MSGPDLGKLAHAERAMLPDTSATRVRAHYEKMHVVAIAARDELRTAMFAGLPRLGPETLDAMVGIQHARVTRLVNAFSWANRSLWRAAETLCDLEDLPDDGADARIVWQVKL